MEKRRRSENYLFEKIKKQNYEICVRTENTCEAEKVKQHSK